MRDIDPFLGATRSSCLAWIKESKQTWTDLAALTGIPTSRLRTLNLDAVDLSQLAAVLDTMRPFDFENEAAKRAKNTDDIETARHLAEITAGFKEHFPQEWESTMNAAQEQAEYVTKFEELSRPLTEVWRDVSFIEERPDKRRLNCERCDYEWLARRSTPPKACPRCQSPYWNRVEATASAE